MLQLFFYSEEKPIHQKFRMEKLELFYWENLCV